MKKTLLCVTFLFLTFYWGEAQESTYGIRLGANLSSISSDDIPENLEDNRFGIVVGFLAEFPIKEKLSLQPEFQYSSKGNDDETLRVDYLQLPIFLKYNFSNLVNVHIGPQVGLKIWEWEDNAGIDANFNTFDFSAVAGVGVNITENFFADLRYDFGLSNIVDDEGIPGGAEGNNRTIQLSFGYKL
ncbi:PorT family protein [Aquimarina sp. D1M17]|uniref:porin family protein n=1 Tax=Aquimarina acroporae TaxID=2937283 RepID=UPI0020BF68B4|nr:porin family protein [Aquimarina acroporae]MCK8520311.1 PorT family protein [Aquimarina acroporae]